MDFIFSSLGSKKQSQQELALQKSRVKSHAARFSQSAKLGRRIQNKGNLTRTSIGIQSAPNKFEPRLLAAKTDLQGSASINQSQSSDSDNTDDASSSTDSGSRKNSSNTYYPAKDYAVQSWNWISRIGMHIHDFVPGGDDPGIAASMDYHLKFVLPMLDKIGGSFGVVNFYGNWFLEKMTAFPDLSFAVMALLKAGHTLVVLGREVSCEEVAAYQAEALAHLRHRLSMQDTTNDDSTILTSLMLAATSIYLKDPASGAVHMIRVRQMLEHRGGIEELKVDDNIKAVCRHWQIMTRTLGEGILQHSPPTYPSRPLSPAIVSMADTFPPGFRDLALTCNLSYETIRILSNIQQFHGPDTPPNVVPHTTTTGSPPYSRSFIESCPALGLPDTPKPSVEKLLCLATIAFFSNSHAHYRNIYGWIHHGMTVKLTDYFSPSSSTSSPSSSSSSTSSNIPTQQSISLSYNPTIRAANLWIHLTTLISTSDSLDPLGPDHSTTISMVTQLHHHFPETIDWTTEDYDAAARRFFWNKVVSDRLKRLLDAVAQQRLRQQGDQKETGGGEGDEDGGVG